MHGSQASSQRAHERLLLRLIFIRLLMGAFVSAEAPEAPSFDYKLTGPAPHTNTTFTRAQQPHVTHPKRNPRRENSNAPLLPRLTHAAAAPGAAYTHDIQRHPSLSQLCFVFFVFFEMAYFAQAPRDAAAPVHHHGRGRGGAGVANAVGGGGGGGAAWAMGGSPAAAAAGASSSSSHHYPAAGGHRGLVVDAHMMNVHSNNNKRGDAAGGVSREEAVRRFVAERARQDDYGEQARPRDFRAGHGLHAGRWEERAGWKSSSPAAGQAPAPAITSSSASSPAAAVAVAAVSATGTAAAAVDDDANDDPHPRGRHEGRWQERGRFGDGGRGPSDGVWPPRDDDGENHPPGMGPGMHHGRWEERAAGVSGRGGNPVHHAGRDDDDASINFHTRDDGHTTHANTSFKTARRDSTRLFRSHSLTTALATALNTDRRLTVKFHHVQTHHV